MPRHRAVGTPTLATRCLCALAAVVALVLAAIAGSGLLSTLYTSVARDVVRHSGGRANGAEAAALATRLAPWRADAWLSLAQSMSVRREPREAIDATQAALALAPADAYSWLYLARLRGATGRFDERTLEIYRMALRRAPQSVSVHEAIAMDGVLRWRHGDEALRTLWLGSMRYTLQRRRVPFLRSVVLAGRDPWFCTATQEDLGLTRWCAQAARLRANCAQPQLAPAAEEWCASVGLRAGTPAGRRR